MYEEAFKSVVEEALANESKAKEHRSGIFKVKYDSVIKVTLFSPDLEEDESEYSVWRGKYAKFDFAPMIPNTIEREQILFIASIYFDGILSTKLKFIVNVNDTTSSKPEIERKDIHSAFLSYASEDRGRVAAIKQGMRKTRPDIDLFFDVESLRSGDRWEEKIFQEIDKRDVLFLFWSQHAKDSVFVNKEWRYALEKKGINFIEPCPIEPPNICPPPVELNMMHFNDRELLYYQ